MKFLRVFVQSKKDGKHINIANKGQITVIIYNGI